jgi:hypothetical protein
VFDIRNKKKITKRMIDEFSSKNNKKDYPVDFLEKLMDSEEELPL